MEIEFVLEQLIRENRSLKSTIELNFKTIERYESIVVDLKNQINTLLNMLKMQQKLDTIPDDNDFKFDWNVQDECDSLIYDLKVKDGKTYFEQI
jgi:hypothetical protein